MSNDQRDANILIQKQQYKDGIASDFSNVDICLYPRDWKHAPDSYGAFRLHDYLYLSIDHLKHITPRPSYVDEAENKKPMSLYEQMIDLLVIAIPKYNPFKNRVERDKKKASLTVYTTPPKTSNSISLLGVPRYWGCTHIGLPPAPHPFFLPEAKGNANFTFHAKPRNQIQLQCIQSYLNHLHPDFGGGGLIHLPCGFGKTFIGLYLIASLLTKEGGKAVWITNRKDSLGEQAKKAAELYMPSLVGRTSIIGGSGEPNWDADFFIIVVQKIAHIPKVPDHILKSVRMAVVDECHHGPALSFLQALQKFAPKYTLGLSATIHRPDGLSFLTHWFLGPVVFAHYPDTTLVPTTVLVLHPSSTDQFYQPDEYPMNVNGVLVTHLFNQELAEEPTRACAMLDVCIRHCLAKAKKKEQAVIFCKMVWLVKALTEITHRWLQENRIDLRVDEYHGGIKEEDRAEIRENTQLLISTDDMMKEGVDMTHLSCVGLLGSYKEVKQMIGRAGRSELNMSSALIVDICDHDNMEDKENKIVKRLRKRLGQYDKMTVHHQVYHTDKSILSMKPLDAAGLDELCEEIIPLRGDEYRATIDEKKEKMKEKKENDKNGKNGKMGKMGKKANKSHRRVDGQEGMNEEKDDDKRKMINAIKRRKIE